MVIVPSLLRSRRRPEWCSSEIQALGIRPRDISRSSRYTDALSGDRPYDAAILSAASRVDE